MTNTNGATALVDSPPRDETATPSPQRGEFRLVRAGDIVPWPELNPRRRFNPEKHEKLVASVRKHGVRQTVALHIRPMEEQLDAIPFWLVAGERRWRAASAISPDELIPAMVKIYTHEEALEIALIENLDRDDLTATEEARGFKDLMEKAHWTQDRIAERFECSQEHISNRIRLLQLPDEILELLDEELIAPTHARDYLLPFVGIPHAKRKKLFAAVIKDVRQTEKVMGSAIRGDELKDEVARTARELSKPIGTKDGVTPLFDPKQHAAECTCTGPKFSYGYSAAHRRCFDEQWWDRAQAAARRKRAKEREQQKDDTKKVAKTAKSSGALDENAFRKKYGYQISPLGNVPIDVSKLEGAEFVVVGLRGGKEKEVYCVTASKLEAATRAARAEIEQLAKSLGEDAYEHDCALAASQPIEPWMCAEFIRVHLDQESLLNEFGIAHSWQTLQKTVAELQDDQCAMMVKVVALRARRGDYGKQAGYRLSRFEGQARAIVEKKYKPALQQLRRRVLAGKSDAAAETPAPAAKNGKSAPKTKAPKARNAPNPVFMKPMQPSAELAAVIGDTPLPRVEITKLVWAYIKKHGLQDQKERRMINCDEKLKVIFGGKARVSMFEMTKLVNSHLSEPAAATSATNGKRTKARTEQLEEATV
jgi:ParB/RepB/Spo0J family partition protein